MELLLLCLLLVFFWFVKTVTKTNKMQQQLYMIQLEQFKAQQDQIEMMNQDE